MKKLLGEMRNASSIIMVFCLACVILLPDDDKYIPIKILAGVVFILTLACASLPAARKFFKSILILTSPFLVIAAIVAVIILILRNLPLEDKLKIGVLLNLFR